MQFYENIVCFNSQGININKQLTIAGLMRGWTLSFTLLVLPRVWECLCWENCPIKDLKLLRHVFHVRKTPYIQYINTYFISQA